MRRASFLQPEAFYPTRRSTAVCCCCCCLYPDVAEDRPLPASGRHSPAATQQFLSVTLHPAASGTSPHPSPSSSSLDGSPLSRFPRPPSPCPARFFPSPPCRAPISRKYLRSASRTACLLPAAAAVCTCPPLPSIPKSTSPTSRRLPRLSAPSP